MSPDWDVTLILQSLTKAPYEPLQTSDERFLAQKTFFLLALASAKRIGEPHALSHRISHSRDWDKVSFTFVAGFVAKTQDPSSSAPRFERFTVPACQTRAKIAMGDCYVPCGRSGVTWTELLHITRDVSGCSSPQDVARRRSLRTRSPSGSGRRYLGRTSSWGGSVPDPPPRARETRDITPSLQFKKNFAVDQVLKVGTWCRHTTFTRHYLRDLAHRSLETFHLGPMVAAQALV